MRADTSHDCNTEESDSHTDTSSYIGEGLAGFLSSKVFFSKVDNGLQGDHEFMSSRIDARRTLTRIGPINCDVSPRTLNNPPSQKDKPRVSLRAHARLASFRPSCSSHCLSRAARFSLYPEPRFLKAWKVHFARFSTGGRISPFSSRAFHSCASFTLRAHASSNLSPRGPHSRELSSFQRSVAWSVR